MATKTIRVTENDRIVECRGHKRSPDGKRHRSIFRVITTREYPIDSDEANGFLYRNQLQKEQKNDGQGTRGTSGVRRNQPSGSGRARAEAALFDRSGRRDRNRSKVGVKLKGE